MLSYESWKQAKGPQTRDELHEYIKVRFGVNIPRVAVCPEHQAPFDFLADLYFEDVGSALALASRGGAKTWMAALLIFLSAKFRPGTEGATVASEQQTSRAYNHLKELIRKDGNVDDVEQHPDIEHSHLRETKWRNTSLYEIIIATMGGTSGPHPQKVHTDEVDHMDPVVFQNSRNMSASKGKIMAQDILTSTRYRASGLMQHLWNECDEAERDGFQPAYKRYMWCVFECAQPVPNCQCAHPDLPPEERCACDRIAKGKWESGEPRRFSDVCQGRLARSDGWVPLTDIHKTFLETLPDTWAAQQECSKPSTAGMRLPEWELERHGVRNFMPDPKNGPIYASVDFGGTNPTAITFGQVLTEPVLVLGYQQEEREKPQIELPVGSLVVFDEIYKAELAPSLMADMVLKRIKQWQVRFPEFEIRPRRFFYDVQAKGAYLEWRAHKPPIILSNFATKDVDLHTTYWRNMIVDEKFYVDVTRCQFLPQEIQAWHNPDPKPGQIDQSEKPVKDFDHAVDSVRYMIANLRAIDRNRAASAGKTGAAETGHGGATSRTGSGPSRYLPGASSIQAVEHIKFPRPAGWPTGG